MEVALPLAPLVPLALRLGAVAAAGWAVRRAIRRGVQTGRTDQRAEDALDDTSEGVALHRPADRTGDGISQTNTSARFIRTIRWGGSAIQIDGALLARLRIRKL